MKKKLKLEIKNTYKVPPTDIDDNSLRVLEFNSVKERWTSEGAVFKFQVTNTCIFCLDNKLKPDLSDVGDENLCDIKVHRDFCEQIGFRFNSLTSQTYDDSYNNDDKTCRKQ